METVELAVVGAGPYGLATAARACARGVDAALFGKPMGFWRDCMPAQMLLRSGRDWHLDPAGVDTFEAFLACTDTRLADAEPIPIGMVLDYSDWFIERQALGIRRELVVDCTAVPGGIRLELSNGERLTARTVVAAPGIAKFAQFPEWARQVPEGRRSHTVERVRFDDVAGARCLVVGGRQSAYEWAALLCEHDAAAVHVVHRHPVPRFAAADWSFVDAYMDDTMATPGWWRRLSDDRRTQIGHQFWSVGRLTLEPWIPQRLDPERVRSWPRSEVTRVAADAGDELQVTLSDGAAVTVDEIIFATGFRSELGYVNYLAGLSDTIAQRDGFPVLDENFATTVPGLYLTGFLATQDFGPFFGFMRAAIVAATIIVDDITRKLA